MIQAVIQGRDEGGAAALAAAVQAQMRAAADGVLDMMFMSPVLETAAFPPPNWVDPIVVGLNFEGGGARGACALAVEEATARSLAQVFLCVEDGVGGEMSRLSAREVVCELSNMLCGAFLGHFDGSRSYRLSPPRSMLPGEIGACRQLHRSLLQTKHGGLLFILAFESDKHFMAPPGAETA